MSLELQCRIKLDQDGMMDGPSLSPSYHLQTQTGTGSDGDGTTLHAVTMSTSERLARLRQLRHAWQTLRWSRMVTGPMPGACCAYELVGGIFCKTQPAPGGRVSGFGVGLGHGFGGDGGGFAAGGGPGWLGVDGVGWISPGLGTWGLHLHANATGNGVWEDDGGGLGALALSATWLPGRAVGDMGRTVVRHDLGMPTWDFAMDPSQDVIVLFNGGDEV